MKKRSRLDLSAGVEPDKPQAAVLSHASAGAAQERAARQRTQAGKQASSAPAPGTRKLVLKALAIAALAAVSILLLKRRLL